MKNKTSLLINGLTKFSLGFLAIGPILFIPAGNINYLNGWLLIITLIVPMALLGIYLAIKDPELLERRLESKEPSREQGKYILAFGIIYLISFVLSGLDFRFSWSNMPFAVSVFLQLLY